MTATISTNPLVLAAALTNAELDQAIADANTARESAWAAQAAVTTADGYKFRNVYAVANQALEAEVYYRGLCAEREQREITRADLGRLIGEIRAYPMAWSKTGPWTYAVSGSNRIHRADRLVDFCRNHNMPYKLSYSDGQVEVTFWRNHISSLATAASGREITPNSPLKSPASLHGEGGYATDLQTQRVAVPSA